MSGFGRSYPGNPALSLRSFPKYLPTNQSGPRDIDIPGIIGKSTFIRSAIMV